MIKLKYNKRQDQMEIWNGNTFMAGFDSESFGDLLYEIKKFIENGNPRKYAKKREENQRKIYREIRRINRRVAMQALLAKVFGFFKHKEQ
jgi:hypothetical protein